MDLLKARIFLYAVDSGSLSKAALVFDYSPSGISHMMSALEKEVGFPLLIRTKTGILPTPDAEKLIPILRSLCRWNEEFLQTSSEIRGLSQGTLRIGAYSSIATHWLPDILANFHRDYPNINIELQEGVWQEIDKYLQDRRVDLGFLSFQENMKYHWIPLKNDPMLVAVPPDHPLAGKEAIQLNDLRDQPLIMPAFGSDLDVLNVLREGDIPLKFSVMTLENYSAMGMVERGMGLLITNELITKGRENRVRLLPFDPPRQITLGIALPVENKVIPVVKSFIQYARQAFPAV